ncbi:MAG: hypothetical protein HFJ12_06155 [Bacilli bacterium]|nr:hypothetical protein [Bacilli bacterium]
MILFETRYTEIFNHTIQYLIKENKDQEIEDIIDEVAPRYLRREQFRRCVITFSNLIEYTKDKYYHRLDSLSKILLYRFLSDDTIPFRLRELRKNKKYQYKLKDITHKYILKEEEINQNLYNIDWYKDRLFIDDIVFLFISDDSKKLKEYLNEHPSMLLPYLDILPLEIQNSLKKDMSLYQSIQELLDFIQENIDHGNLSEIFWHDEIPMSEIGIQEVLICLLDAYFHKIDVDINRETVVGNGKIDFKFYRHQDEVILFEIKKASNRNLRFGYDHQLIDYMRACRCQYSYYIVLCFNQKDIAIAKKFIEDVRENNYFYNVDIVILDLCKRDRIFSNHNESIFYKQISPTVNGYFNDIPNILTLSKSFEFIEYLKMLLDHFKNITIEELKQDYLLKVHEVSTFYKSSDFNSVDWFGEDGFYIIHEEQPLRRFILNLLRDIKTESTFLETIPEILNLLKTFRNRKNHDHISKSEILEIFQYLKREQPLFYQIIKSKKLVIYLLDETSCEFNSSIIPIVDIGGYLLLCSNMMEKKEEGYPVYVFFFLLGQIFHLFLSKGKKEVPESFINAMRPYTSGLRKDHSDASILFADSVAMYLMHNSKYNQYNPFSMVDDDVYQKLDSYFDQILEKVGVSNDCMC